ncbi:MAG TPA: HD domain-containing protein [Ruminococcus sp.]|mgnify:CR=1 FL=1|nr:HD domain-containing protein [Ruminococcus sp.]
MLNMDERLRQQISFMLELDKMKALYRQTYVLNEDRKENDAEHSWHLAVMAFLLAEHSNLPVDVLKVMKMVLIHDVVEIDAGDTYCYDTEGYKTKADREEKAAQRIFGLLPTDQKDEFYSLWREFEEAATADSKFANLLDRLQPILLNYTRDGISWKEHGVFSDQVRARNLRSGEASDDIAALIEEIIRDAEANGFLSIR